MNRMTKEQIGRLVRRVIHQNTGRNPKAMHLDSRLYFRDADGEYPKNYSGKTLGIVRRCMEDILLDLCDDLHLDHSIYTGWNKKDSSKCAPIKYHKDTRLHHLIDLVHDEYNKVAARNTVLDEKKETQEPVNNTEVSIIDMDGNVNLYYIKIVKDDLTLYVAEDVEDGFTFIQDKNFMTLFTAGTIEEIFDLSSEDVIANAVACPLANFLAGISPPFEISIIQIKEIDDGDYEWTYDEEDKIKQILRNSDISDEDRNLILSRLK